MSENQAKTADQDQAAVPESSNLNMPSIGKAFTTEAKEIELIAQTNTISEKAIEPIDMRIGANERMMQEDGSEILQPGSVSDQSELARFSNVPQQKLLKPSDENQLYSDKVESIEVLIRNEDVSCVCRDPVDISAAIDPVPPMEEPCKTNFLNVVPNLDSDKDLGQDRQLDQANLDREHDNQMQFVQHLDDLNMPMREMHFIGGADVIENVRTNSLEDYEQLSRVSQGGKAQTAQQPFAHEGRNEDQFGGQPNDENRGHHTRGGSLDDIHENVIVIDHPMNGNNEVVQPGGAPQDFCVEVNVDDQVLFPNDSDQLNDEGAALAADSGQNDRRFYSLIELAEMEPMLERRYYDGVGSNAHGAHVLLSPQEFRAKLYWLDQENRWKDIGTGRFRLLLSKDQEEHYIQVVSEECIDDQMPMGEEIDKVVDEMVQVQDGAVISGQPQNQANTTGGHNTSKQVFLHRCFVHCLQEFSRQGDTIITWQDDYRNEFALSFQDEKGAQNTWWSICFLKGIQINSNIDEPNEGGGTSETNSISGAGVVLPTKENLADLVNELYSQDAYTRRSIAETVLKQDDSVQRNRENGNNVNGASSDMSERDHTKLQTFRSAFLDKLQKLFNEVEQTYRKATKAMEENEGDEHDRCIHITQQVNHLHSFFQIFRNLLNLNHSELLEVLLNENYWLTTFGALEYDPEVFSPMGFKYEGNSNGARSPTGPKMNVSGPNSSLQSSPNSAARSYGSYDHFDQANQFNASLAQEADFRDFLQNKVRFKTAVEINDPQVLYSIHLSYKLQYLKDTAMARFIEEPTSHTIMQLVSQLHQLILDYIIGDEFERIQSELINKMRNNQNVEDKENALKFFLEICALLKSINLTFAQLTTCKNAFTKIMKVLAQIFDVMLPDRKTLIAEVTNDREALIQIFDERNQKDIQNNDLSEAKPMKNKDTGDQNNLKDNDGADAKELKANASVAQADSSNQPESDQAKDQSQTPERAHHCVNKAAKIDESNEQIQMQSTSPANKQCGSIKDFAINPGRSTVEEYLKSPMNSEDPKMTQIDILKSNSIEIFYNLLMLLNNVNHSTVRDFLQSDEQKKQNYVFLRHLAQHMMYSSQQGIKVSICEFFKDLTLKESQEMHNNFQQIILHQVVSQLVAFLDEDELFSEDHQASKDQYNQNCTDQDDLLMQIESSGRANEEQKNQDSRQATLGKVIFSDKNTTAFRKQIDQSRILILQFINKLISENVDQYPLRTFLHQNKVLMRVISCSRYNSIQTNVEIVKFFKAIIQSKDTVTINSMIKKQIFEKILEIFLKNVTKGNLLHSCILNLFDMLTPIEPGAASASGNGSILVMNLDSGYGAPKTEGGYLQLNLLQKLYQRLYENGFVKRVFMNKKYEEGFRRFNRHLHQSLDLHMSEIDSKQASDIDRSNSQHGSNCHQESQGGASRPRRIGPTVAGHGPEALKADCGKGQTGSRQEPYDIDMALSQEKKQVEVDGQGVKGQLADHDKLFGPSLDQQKTAGEQVRDGSGEVSAFQVSSQDKADPESRQAEQEEEKDSGARRNDRDNSSIEMIEKSNDELNGNQDIKMNETQLDNQDKHDGNTADELQDCQNKPQNQTLNATKVSGRVNQNLPSSSNVKRSGYQPWQPAAMRGARSISPISGHAEKGTSNQPSEASQRDFFEGLLPEPAQRPATFAAAIAGHSPDQRSPQRARRLSHEDLIGLNKQGSGNSIKSMNLSDEACGSIKGAGTNKQAFSETCSNPDLDEYFFNKGGEAAATPAIQLSKKITSMQDLKLQRQNSPNDGGSIIFASVGGSKPAGETTPGNNQTAGWPFKKSHKKHQSRPKFERGRRACSENPPTRTELVKLSFNGPENIIEARGADNNQEIMDKTFQIATTLKDGGDKGQNSKEKEVLSQEVLTKLLDAKLPAQVSEADENLKQADTIVKPSEVDALLPRQKGPINPLRMLRSESICDDSLLAPNTTQEPQGEVKIGVKRSRQAMDGAHRSDGSFEGQSDELDPILRGLPSKRACLNMEGVNIVTPSISNQSQKSAVDVETGVKAQGELADLQMKEESQDQKSAGQDAEDLKQLLQVSMLAPKHEE